jgi:hypothetical protein
MTNKKTKQKTNRKEVQQKLTNLNREMREGSIGRLREIEVILKDSSGVGRQFKEFALSEESIIQWNRSNWNLQQHIHLRSALCYICQNDLFIVEKSEI